MIMQGIYKLLVVVHSSSPPRILYGYRLFVQQIKKGCLGKWKSTTVHHWPLLERSDKKGDFIIANSAVIKLS